MKKQVSIISLILAFAIQSGIVYADNSQQPQRKTPAIETKAITPKERARKRFEEDRNIYSVEELRDIEKLYQVANKQWNSPEAKESLKILIEKYPKANRTGCALQYLGQMSSEKRRSNTSNVLLKILVTAIMAAEFRLEPTPDSIWQTTTESRGRQMRQRHCMRKFRRIIPMQ